MSRKIIESEIWEKPPLYLKVWIYLLASAQHQEYKNLKRGQLRTSIPEIVNACSWKVGYRTERPSKDQIFKILNWLRKVSERGNESYTKATMITTTKATQGIIVTIDNYAFYQEPKNYESDSEGDNEGVTKAKREQQRGDNINKNDKNDKNDNNISAKIKNFRERYSDHFLQEIDKYINFIRGTRKRGEIADSIILKIYEKFSQYDPVVVEYAIKTHMGKPEYSKAKEEYTFGILRRTSLEEAKKKIKTNEQKVERGKFDTESFLSSLED